jgi:formylglycine-generating enzyme required for sulfatase activity
VGANSAEPIKGRFTNAIGMRMVRIEPGSFRMGNDGEIDYSSVATDAVRAPYRSKGEGQPPMSADPLEWDESPSHVVSISRAFYMAATPVTNAQYERFRPGHQRERGRRGFSREDEEAVLFVSWHDAGAFAEWLSELEDRPYRLPTEAEWEYACRAGTTTAYFTGPALPEVYHQHQVMNRQHQLRPESVSLRVGRRPPNAWGLHDMHGVVEEWCLDWYGPYEVEAATDPVGRVDGIARVTRGGSHSTGLPFLRSANRAGALPEARSFLIGFRVVIGALPGTAPRAEPPSPRWARDVCQEPSDWDDETPMDEPVFWEPRTFTRIPDGANGPLYITHNHCPALTAMPNGDLLAIWFTTVFERGREMVIAGARLRRGQVQWDEADVFFHVPDRNVTGSALWWDGNETIYHFNGVGAGDHWRDLSLAMRTSTDNGASWTRPRLIGPRHQSRHQVIDGVMRAASGMLVLACDATHEGEGGTVVHISSDGGLAWYDPGLRRPPPKFREGQSGAWIAGIHAGIVELADGRWMALGRGDGIRGRMPKSVSGDRGRTWTYLAGPFPPIGGAQRLTLMRLREGPLLAISFADKLSQRAPTARLSEGSGMFAALSFDEGRTWPTRRLMTPGPPRRILDAPCNRRWGEPYSTLDWNRAEGRGYLTAVQTPDGVIHLISSGTHYAFNLAWLKAE